MHRSYLDHLSSAVTALLLADSRITPCAVLEERRGLIESDVLSALAGLLTRPGGTTSGLTLIVKAPEVLANESDGPTPLLQAALTIRVIEQPEVNADPVTGTGLSAAVAAERVLAILHGWRHAGLSGSILEGTQTPIRSVETPGGAVAYDVTLHSRYTLPSHARVARPIISLDGTQITLSTTTPGAEIYYTYELDQLPDYPSSADMLSLYVSPVSLPAMQPGQTCCLLAAAYHPDHLPSSCAEIRILAEPIPPTP
jgi:hypothetical protein